MEMINNIACNNVIINDVSCKRYCGRSRTTDDYMNGSKMADNAPIYESDSNSEDSIAL